MLILMALFILFRATQPTLPVRGMLQRRPTRRMVHEVMILVPFFNFFHKNHKQSLKHNFSIFFPPEGNFDIDAEDGDGGGWGWGTI